MLFATTGRHLYYAAPIKAFEMMGYATMQSMVMLEASKTGMLQGEIQGASSSLQTIVRVVAPSLWSNVYQWDVARGKPGQGFYLGLMVWNCFYFLLSRTLRSRPPPPPPEAMPRASSEASEAAKAAEGRAAAVAQGEEEGAEGTASEAGSEAE